VLVSNNGTRFNGHGPARDVPAAKDVKADEALGPLLQALATAFKAPKALLLLFGGEWPPARIYYGTPSGVSEQEVGFGKLLLELGNRAIVVRDTCDDIRLRAHPLVARAPFIRYCASLPLLSASGAKLGLLAVIDYKPREKVYDEEIKALESFAALIADHFERRRLSVFARAFSRMANSSSDAFLCFSDEGHVTFWNPVAERLFGYSTEEVLEKPVELLLPGIRTALQEKRHSRTDKSGRNIEIQALRKDRPAIPVELSLSFWRDQGQGYFGAIVRDLSKDRVSDEHMRYLTHFDALTNLPNRAQFIEAIAGELSSDTPFSVLQIGLDKFKTINGSLGIAAGDLVLKTMAQRILEAVTWEARVARLGGDEFGILLHGLDKEEQARDIARIVLDAVGQACHVHGMTCHVDASVGMVLVNRESDFDDANAVLKSGLLALLEAKKSGGRCIYAFHHQLSLAVEERRALDEELRLALARGEFELYFQPQVRLDTSVIVGAEALLRWRHPLRGLLAPVAFLAALEVSDIAIDVGRWIIDTACRFAAEVNAAHGPLRISINLFAVQLKDTTLYETITGALARYDLPPHLLELELTETTVLDLEEEVIGPLRNLRKLGLGIAFDDYGTGYGSLSLLKRYPVTRLKIDREFVCGIMLDPDDAAIVKAVVALGKSMGFRIIAEGIETQDQAAKLRSLKCEEAQGFLFGRPMPSDKLYLLIRERNGMFEVSAA